MSKRFVMSTTNLEIPQKSSVYFDQLFGNRVAFKDKGRFHQIIETIKQSGPDNLHVITDFDFTLTKFWLNGSRGASCHKVIEDSHVLHAEYHTKAQALQRKYYPIEVDPNINMDEKTKHMVDWVTQAHELLVNSGLTKPLIKNAVSEAIQNQRIALRKGALDFITHLESLKIPLLIFSAGLSDVLKEVLDAHLKINENLVYIISNKGIFEGQEQTLRHFEEPTIHVFNKKASTFMNSEFFRLTNVKERKNMILLGDSLGDIHMSEGVNADPQGMMKLGFLNDRTERLHEYLEHFDLVILDDPGFDIPLEILKCVSHSDYKPDFCKESPPCN